MTIGEGLWLAEAVCISDSSPGQLATPDLLIMEVTNVPDRWTLPTGNSDDPNDINI